MPLNNPTIVGPIGTKKEADGDIRAMGPHNPGPIGLSVPLGDAVSPIGPGNYGTNSGVKLIKMPIKPMA